MVDIAVFGAKGGPEGQSQIGPRPPTQELGVAGLGPLRSFDQLCGLAGLRPRELRQCRQGSAFMLQAVMVCIWHIVYGGIYKCTPLLTPST